MAKMTDDEAYRFIDEKPARTAKLATVKKDGSPHRDPWVSMCFVIGGRYMGDDLAEAYGRRNAVPGELLVRCTPSRIIAGRDIAS